jgi:uncharacterized protein YjhX (UPF0386 family)
MGKKTDITVHVKYGELEKTFVGDLEAVWHSINRFFCEIVPTFDVAHKLLLTFDLKNLIESVKGVIGLSQEGQHILVSKDKLTDNEILTLTLLAIYLRYKLGLSRNDSATREELQARLGKSRKITITRLAELIKKDIIAKSEEGNYRITTYGIKYVQEKLLPKLKRNVV